MGQAHIRSKTQVFKCWLVGWSKADVWSWTCVCVCVLNIMKYALGLLYIPRHLSRLSRRLKWAYANISHHTANTACERDVFGVSWTQAFEGLKCFFSLFFDNPLFNCGYFILKPNHLSLLVILSINGGEEQQWLSLCYDGALKWMTQFLLISVATADSDWNQQPTQPAAPHCVFAGLLILVVEKGAVLWL